MLLGVLGGSIHGHELEEDGGVDGPYSVGSRICSGKGTKEVADGDMSVSSRVPQSIVGLGRVHHDGVLLDNG